RHTRFSRDWSSDVCSSDLPWPARNYNDQSPDKTVSSNWMPKYYLNWRSPVPTIVKHWYYDPSLYRLPRPASGKTGLTHPHYHRKIGRASCRERAETAAELA